MNLNETKKGLNPEIKKGLEKSKLQVLTNENDFLVKNLKKAGWSTWIKIFFKHQISKPPSWDKNNILLNNYPKSLSLSNIKFLLNIQINTLHTKHIEQILVILA